MLCCDDPGRAVAGTRGLVRLPHLRAPTRVVRNSLGGRSHPILSDDASTVAAGNGKRAKMSFDAPASLPVLLTEASLRETTGHEPVDTLLDLAVELRPLGLEADGKGTSASAHGFARRAYNARLRGDPEGALA